MKSNPVVRKKNSKIKHNSFPIVAIGASTGGLDAVSELLKNIPPTTGMAFIYVQHLSPNHKSFLTAILSKITKMKVQEIDDMELMKPDNVYIIPFNKGIKVTDGHIKLVPRSKSGKAISIDILFSSLAETHKENVIGIVLSGNAKDGTIGLKAIKNAGGITFAQDDSAQASSMPQSAIDSGVVDYILSPKKIAAKLTHLNKNGVLIPAFKGKENKIAEEDDADLKVIFDLLLKENGVDFSHYKMTTIKRRLNNRMVQGGAKTTKEYAKNLLKKRSELDLLYKDLLINVTQFFRDKNVFQYLKKYLLPKLLKNKLPGESLRIWIPGCSTGEEAYSIAILLAELQDDKPHKVPVQIFATDLSYRAIHTARIGEYTPSDIKLISKNNVKRFFSKTGNTYKVSKELREMCVFASHNILSDPPFFRIDFISCRNLLIYFDATAQKKALTTLHFALNDNGYLMLGKSETTNTSSQLYTQINNRLRIFSRKKNTGTRKSPELSSRFTGVPNYTKNIKQVSKKTSGVATSELDSAINAILLSRYMPACAIINKDMEILQFRGSTSLYLSHPSGKASLNILKMMRPEFAFELRNAINKTIKTSQPVNKSGIEIKINGELRMMTLEVSSLKIDWDEPLLLIVFTLQEQVEKNIKDKGEKNNSLHKDRKIKKLTDELNTARAEIYSVIESQEKAYEELQSANEEIVSTNEEFQTLNEELETSKEEVEATNEELISTNQELKTHNELLAESYNYSQTIIATIHEPMLILDSNLNVKSANKSFCKKFLVTLEETEGMHLFELSNKQWDIPKLRLLLESVLSRNSAFESLEVTHVFPGLGEKIMVLNASRIIQKTHREKLILLAIEDITKLTHHHLKEKELIKNDIIAHEANKLILEKAIRLRTKQLNEKNLELENVNKDLLSFNFISSHDLQEPLRKIQTFVDCLVEEENLSVNGKKYLKRTYETAKHMRALIEGLLTYSRTRSTDRIFENIDIGILVNEVKYDFAELIHEKKVIIKTIELCESPVIRLQFRQLIYNLISNSLKFSEPGRALRIEIKSKIISGSKLNNKKLSSKINYCHITYSDNGIGFDPQYNERIFEVFQRLHSQEKYQGTGMGLAICKRIVENHNGIITATGKLNKGTRFDIYIPANR